ncbi:ATP-binding protein [Miltoncostaea oceani]|uniref:ATP-binding protein n=1 Tax=Miltoncostaea oceani TaxID=2843216 RepID=UPI001FE3731D|nr:ATP-binding protein [Miltoncostaea oceani]
MVDESLAATDRAPASARDALRRRSWERLDADVFEHLVLVVSELVTNSVLHAGLADGQAIRLRVVQGADRVRVEVEDDGLGFRFRPLADGCESRGLLIVAGLSERWGLESCEPTRVWAELREPAPPARAGHLHVVPTPAD